MVQSMAYTLDHRADPLGTGARCAAMHSYTRVSARRYVFSPHLDISRAFRRFIVADFRGSDFFHSTDSMKIVLKR